jgi:spore coat protein A, manganese oxidase
MLNRRKLLLAGGLAVGVLGAPRLLAIGDSAARTGGIHDHVAQHRAGRTARSAVTPTPFTERMPVPRALRPVRSTADADTYVIDIRPANVEILPGLRTPAFTYNGQFVGPTIRARTGRPVTVTYRNTLDRAANVHLHGGHVPPTEDGHPMTLIEPGQSRSYHYPNTQQGATLWYHDHSHHTEAENVYRGLNGFYLIDDPAEADLRLPSGAYDVPISLRDAQFDDTGALVFDNPANRTTILANGKPLPYFQVAARKYRFRLLNSANERAFRLDLGGVPMIQIASDGGLLPAPVTRTELGITSGERVDVVVDFSRHPVGSKLVLSDRTGPALRFDVVRTATDDSRVPARLRALPALPPATVERDVELSFNLDGEPTGLVNGRPFDHNRVDFRIRKGTTEIWRVRNGDDEWGFPHNFHLHLVQFRVLDRDGRPPTLDDAGRKDTVAVAPGETVRVQATFGDYLGRYVYHCHFLEHSSVGMMAQLEIVQ